MPLPWKPANASASRNVQRSISLASLQRTRFPAGEWRHGNLCELMDDERRKYRHHAERENRQAFDHGGELAGPELAHERCEIETGQRHPFTEPVDHKNG